MTKTQYFTATSIDGFIADTDNSLEWLFQVGADESVDDASGRDGGPDSFAPFFAGVGAMAMGSTTYEWVLEHEQLLDQPDKWQDMYDQTPCWVFTHRDLPAIPRADLRFVHGGVAPVHEQMVQAAAGKNVWIIGGGELVGQFADAGLLDEIHLHLAPVLLGSGAPLLPRRLLATDLSLRQVEREGPFAHLVYDVRTA